MTDITLEPECIDYEWRFSLMLDGRLLTSNLIVSFTALEI